MKEYFFLDLSPQHLTGGMLRGRMDTFPVKRRWMIFAIIGCLLFSGTLFFANLGKRDMWSPDESRYAEIAREMVLNHSYLVPRLNQRIYTQKPPFFFLAGCRFL